MSIDHILRPGLSDVELNASLRTSRFAATVWAQQVVASVSNRDWLRGTSSAALLVAAAMAALVRPHVAISTDKPSSQLRRELRRLVCHLFKPHIRIMVQCLGMLDSNFNSTGLHLFLAVWSCGVHLFDGIGEVLAMPRFGCTLRKLVIRESRQVWDVVLVRNRADMDVEEHRLQVVVVGAIVKGVMVVTGVQVTQHLTYNGLIIVWKGDRSAKTFLEARVRLSSKEKGRSCDYPKLTGEGLLEEVAS